MSSDIADLVFSLAHLLKYDGNSNVREALAKEVIDKLQDEFHLNLNVESRNEQIHFEDEVN